MRTRLWPFVMSRSEHAASSAAAAAAAAATARLLSSAGGGEVILRRADPAMRGLALQRLHVATPGGAALLAHDLSLSLEQGACVRPYEAGQRLRERTPLAGSPKCVQRCVQPRRPSPLSTNIC